MERDYKPKKLRHALMLSAATALLCMSASNNPAMAKHDQEKIFETSITKDLNVSSGEPEIAVDPQNPRHLAVIEFAIGSATTPAATYNPGMGGADPEKTIAASEFNGRVMLSKDAGNHWIQAGVPPATDPNSKVRGGGDPMIGIGPDGTIYAADEATPPSTGTSGGMPKSLQEYLSHFNFLVAASTDGGKTFATPQIVGTPADRPWLTVDQSNGMVYTVSSGTLDVKTGVHNVPGPDAPNDRWLIAWQPHLASKSEPHRIGGPDFSGSGANTITAANGVVAATFILGGPAPGVGFNGAPPAATPMPASLQSIVKDGTTSCSMQAPCLFFETSSDQGASWTRHQVVVPGGFSTQRAQVSADPGHPGRYAIGLLSSDRTHFLVVVTDDAGGTWSSPVSVPEAVQGVDFKQWMAYGPTGVLGLMWRKERLDLTPPDVMTKAAANPIFATTGPAYDVYASVSCDGGTTWPSPVRVDAKTSQVGPPGRDDLSYIALDAHYAHLVYGDHRAAAPVPGNPNGVYVAQAYYARVPFSAVTHGASCGRL